MGEKRKIFFLFCHRSIWHSFHLREEIKAATTLCHLSVRYFQVPTAKVHYHPVSNMDHLIVQYKYSIGKLQSVLNMPLQLFILNQMSSVNIKRTQHYLPYDKIKLTVDFISLQQHSNRFCFPAETRSHCKPLHTSATVVLFQLLRLLTVKPRRQLMSALEEQQKECIKTGTCRAKMSHNLITICFAFTQLSFSKTEEARAFTCGCLAAAML